MRALRVGLNDGKPFKVTGPARKKTGYERYYEWQWYEQSSADVDRRQAVEAVMAARRAR